VQPLWQRKGNKYSILWALVIRHAKRMRRVISSSGACPDLQYFAHHLINCTTFGKNDWIHNFVLIFSTSLVRNISHSNKKRTTYLKRSSVFMQSTRYSCQFRKLHKAKLSKSQIMYENFCAVLYSLSSRCYLLWIQSKCVYSALVWGGGGKAVGRGEYK
jgi:hypothetical protein